MEMHLSYAIVDSFWYELLVWTIPNIWAPIHEIGHIIVGWMTLNPTWFTSWNTCGATYNTPMVAFAGYAFDVAFFTWIGLKLRGKWYGWIVLYPIIANLFSIQHNVDVKRLDPLRPYAMVFWTYCVAIGVIVVIVGRIHFARSKARSRKNRVSELEDFCEGEEREDRLVRGNKPYW